jgi:hypothetical protein|tara:strand:+ start:550 stop:756 length:207 start_codon:yes stop_codon:yes gene_type:complete
MNDFEDISAVALFMVKIISKNASHALTENGTDWDWVASEVWHTYPGILNEFLINDAIDFLFEAAEINE